MLHISLPVVRALRSRLDALADHLRYESIGPLARQEVELAVQLACKARSEALFEKKHETRLVNLRRNILLRSTHVRHVVDTTCTMDRQRFNVQFGRVSQRRNIYVAVYWKYTIIP